MTLNKRPLVGVPIASETATGPCHCATMCRDSDACQSYLYKSDSCLLYGLSLDLLQLQDSTGARMGSKECGQYGRAYV